MASEPRRKRLSDVTVKMILTRPVSAIDAAIYTSAKFVEDTSAALSSLPSLARSLEQLRPGGVLLEEAVKANNRLNESIRLLTRGVGLAQETASSVSRTLLRTKTEEDPATKQIEAG